MQNIFVTIYLRFINLVGLSKINNRKILKWVEKHQTPKQRLIRKIDDHNLFQQSDFINHVVNELLKKGFSEENIKQIHYITDYITPLIRIEICTNTNERLYYTV